VIRLGSFMALFCFTAVFVRQDFAFLALVIASYSFFWNGVLPQFEVVTLAHLGRHFRYYSLVRLWGSIGFIAAVWVLGWGFDRFSLSALPWIITCLLLGMGLCSLLLREQPARRHVVHVGNFWGLLRRPVVVAFFLAMFLLQFSHGAFYTFYSIYLEGEGMGRLTIGSLWSLGVLAEVLLFLVMHRILERWSLRPLLLVSLMLSALRWWLIARYGGNLPVLAGAQLLHAASFGCSHAVAIEFVRRYFGAGQQGRGQAFYSGFCFGGGGALGALVSGILWNTAAAATFELAAVACLLALAISWLWVRGEGVSATAREVPW
jgi:PPP family 3-phenylpropionic acid transporter